MGESANELLISLLRAEVESARAEADAVRSSLRYRLGDVLLQALPLSFRSFRVIPKVFTLLLTYRRSLRARASSATGAAIGSMSVGLPAALQCLQVEYNPDAAIVSALQNGVWRTNDVALLVTRLDAAPVSQLVLHGICEPIARRLVRLQLQGCRIVWRANGSGALEQYAQCLVGEIPVGGVR